MKEFLRTKGFKMTPQRELIFRAFFESKSNISVEELFDKVKDKDHSIGYSTVWRNLKLICRVGLAQEINIGDGITRYDRLTKIPHGFLFCTECKKTTEFNVDQIVGMLAEVATENKFKNKSFKIEVQGICSNCQKKKEKRN